ncbi:MAG: ABC transporter ATP-binding protein [Myxococcales bacterium]|nr:ABC transporter ATP-binding protein [Myxococcales bacterium]
MITVEHVSKYYGATAAVSDLNFEIRSGECIGFLGLNGAGKSTTLRLLSCLLLPTAGSIRVRGLDVVSHPHEIRRFIGYLPDQPPLYLEMTVDEYMHFAGRIRGLSGAELERGRNRALSLCSLTNVAHQPIGTLSHGYRQRVGIAQAIIHGPSLLILDEPIQGLDPVQIVEMRKMIGELRGEHTILLSTHILSEIEQTCDRILVMHAGQIAAEGTEAELSERLQAGRRLEVEVRGEPAALRRVLSEVTGIGDLEIAATDGDAVVARMRVDEADHELVSRAIVTADLGLRRMEPVASGLESVFLQLSSGQSQAHREQEEGA